MQNNPVLCPYCGAEMEQCNISYLYWFNCPACCSSSPKITGRTGVYKAAQRRYEPPIMPLTLEEAKKLFDDTPIDIIGAHCWVDESNHFALTCAILDFDADGSLIATWNGGATNNLHEKDYGKTWRCWPRKPTDDERRAVKWESPCES